MASEFERVERYLKARMATMQETDSPITSPLTQPHPFVTISRQAGAGGHSLATALLEEFATHDDTEVFGGWRIFDQELCHMVAGDERFAAELEPLINEEYRSSSSELVRQLLRPGIDQDAVMNRVFQVVRAVAEMGKTIILGRAGSEVTRDLELGVSVRLIAPMHSRLSRLAATHSVSAAKAASMAKKLDAQRSRLLRAHFGADIDDPLGYDVTFNTDHFAFDGIAKAIAAIVSHRAEHAASVDSAQVVR